MRRGLLLALVVLLMTAGSSVWAETVPPKSQALLLLRILAYDHNLARRADNKTVTIVVVYKPGGESEDTANELLKGIRSKNLDRFNRFMECGAGPVPIVRPLIPGTIWVYAGYWMLCAFALIITALFVSAVLIIIGVILISKSETMMLASSVHVYQTLPEGAVITKQLLSLSFSLGAFSAFFLVAAQRSSDRKVFMRNTLRRYRRDLVVYSIYCRAHDQAEPWTLVPVQARLLDHPPRPKGLLGAVIRRAWRRGRPVSNRPGRPPA